MLRCRVFRQTYAASLEQSRRVGASIDTLTAHLKGGQSTFNVNRAGLL